MTTNNTFADPDSDLTVMVLSTGPNEVGEVLPWVNNPEWRPATVADSERGQYHYAAGLTRHAVAFRDDCGQWIRLEYFLTYRAASNHVAEWSRKYPTRTVEVIAAKGKN